MEKKRRLTYSDSIPTIKMEKKRCLTYSDLVPTLKMEKKRCLTYSDSVPTLKMEKRSPFTYSGSIPMGRINDLSDDLLVLILSKLTMKEAARTSVLSHRWEDLWVYYSGDLNFDNVNATFNTRQLSIERPRFISWVNHILNLLRDPTIDGLRVCFDLDASNGDAINRWIKFAMEKTVSRFELNLAEFHGINNNKLYRFPDKLLDSGNNFCTPFGSLTSLRLNCVDLSDEVLAYFISNCRSLEHLSIKQAASVTYLNAATALKLKFLEIEYCRRLKIVDISNSNIESVKFNGNFSVHSSFKNLHSVREVSVSGQWCYRVVINRFRPLPISQLQRLELDIGDYVCTGGIKFPEVFPTLCNLKHLEVRLGASHKQNLLCLTSLIRACPLLSSFTLKVLYADPYPSKLRYELPNCEWRKSEELTHECLKVVEFIGWNGYERDFDIVKYLIEKSVVLEKVIIDAKVGYIGMRSGSVEQIKKVSTERAKLLQKYVPPGMKLVIL